ncbi:MAG: amino acid permease [Methanoregula sp.]|nr:amino acid permease [Methanoregula sp.]
MFQTKSIHQLMEQCQGEHALKRVLQPYELLLLGIGAVVGTGIFVITGVASANYAGPAIILSFVISGLICILAALCYAEFSAMVPVAGSAYTYCYASLGEIWAWIIGWDLILEYAISISAVAIGWSAYVVNLLTNIGVDLPPYLVNPPGVSGGMVNLPAVIIILFITAMLIIGMRESARLNSIIVIINIAVILIFLALTLNHINPANWHPFMPFGINGVFAGAAIVFFAYIGFDAVLTAAEEIKDPQKNLPKGIIGSVVIVMILYVAVAAALTGVVPYGDFALTNAPVAFALERIDIPWGAALISVGALCGITSVILVSLYGQTRIFFAMARDGLLPRFFSEIHARFQTPAKVTLLVGIITAVIASVTRLDEIAELVNIGTLAAFIIVAAGIIVLRRTRPTQERPFKCPLMPVIPLVCIVACGILIYMLPLVTQLRFIVWMLIGLAVYFLFGMKNSTNKPAS